MKDAFNALAFAGQETVQGRAVLHLLIGTPRSPEQISGLIKNLRLPGQTDEALIAKDITADKVLDHRFCCPALIGISRNQVIEDRNAKEGAKRLSEYSKNVTDGATPSGSW